MKGARTTSPRRDEHGGRRDSTQPSLFDHLVLRPHPGDVAEGVPRRCRHVAVRTRPGMEPAEAALPRNQPHAVHHVGAEHLDRAVRPRPARGPPSPPARPPEAARRGRHPPCDPRTAARRRSTRAEPAGVGDLVDPLVVGVDETLARPEQRAHTGDQPGGRVPAVQRRRRPGGRRRTRSTRSRSGSPPGPARGRPGTGAGAGRRGRAPAHGRRRPRASTAGRSRSRRRTPPGTRPPRDPTGGAP